MDHITDLDAQWLMGLVHREADNTAAYTGTSLSLLFSKYYYRVCPNFKVIIIQG